MVEEAGLVGTGDLALSFVKIYPVSPDSHRQFQLKT
jgi:hypothetical protein